MDIRVYRKGKVVMMLIGIVGKLKVSYCVGNQNYEEIIDILKTKKFLLKELPDVCFDILEVQYIEDTIYGISIGIEEQEDFDVWVSGNQKEPFKLGEVSGIMELIF